MNGLHILSIILVLANFQNLYEKEDKMVVQWYLQDSIYESELRPYYQIPKLAEEPWFLFSWLCVL